MTFSDGGVVVVKERNELRHSFDLSVRMETYERVLVYFNGKVHSVKSDLKKTDPKTMLVILLDDLKARLDILENTSIDKHYEYGLSKTVDPQGTLSILNLVNKKCKFTEFPKYLKGQNESEYDIPIYYPNAPKVFSCFMTLSENLAVENHVKKKGLNYDHQETKEEDVRLKPVPRKEHFFCHTCQRCFESYQEHIISSIHITNTSNNSALLLRMSKSFARIRNTAQEYLQKKIIPQKIEKEEMDLRIEHTNQSIDLENNQTQMQQESFCVQPSLNCAPIPSKLDTNNSNSKKLSEKSENKENKENVNSLNKNNLALKEGLSPLVKNSNTKNSNKKICVFSHKKRKFSETLLNSIEADLNEKTRRVKFPELSNKRGFQNFIGELHNLQKLLEKTKSFNIK